MREGHLQHLSAHLNPVARDLFSATVMITGPSGAGKTTIAKYIVRQLEQEVLGIRWGYVNVISNNSKTSVLYSLVRDAGRANDLRAK